MADRFSKNLSWRVGRRLTIEVSHSSIQRISPRGGINTLPNSPDPIDHRMMQKERGIVGRRKDILHIPAHKAMATTVNAEMALHRRMESMDAI